MVQTNQNPLSNFFRQPKVYLTLPSKGKYYPDGSLEMPETGEIPVFAMTARDELMFKTPDALLNGAANVEVIKSCVPAIKNPWAMPSIDIDAVLCAIRVATHGTDMDVTSTCPKCNNVTDSTVDLRQVLEALSNAEFTDQIVVEDSIVVKLRPLSYDQTTKTALKAFEHQRIFMIVNDTEISEDEKAKLVQDSFIKLTDLTFDTVVSCIGSIETSDGSTDNPEFINEFLRNTDKNVFTQIHSEIEKSNKKMAVPGLTTECNHCGEQYQVALSLDQTDFFGKGFSG